MQSCTVDADCGRYNHCDFKEEECVHDDLFDFQTINIVAYCLIGIMLGLQNIGGLGACTIKIFIFMMMLNYSMKESTAVNYPVYLGSKLADNIMALSRKHPVFKDQPLIDYSIILIFLPSVLLGSAMGSTFSPILPNIVLQFMLFLFVGTSFYLTSKKVKKYWDLKKQQQQDQQNEQEKKPEEIDSNTEEKQQQKEGSTENVTDEKVSAQESEKNIGENKEISPVQFEENSSNNDEPANKLPRAEVREETLAPLEEKQQQEIQIEQGKPDESILKKYYNIMQKQKKIPRDIVSYILIILISLFLYYFLLGGKKADSPLGIDMCSTGYWVMWGGQYFLYAAFFVLIYKFLSRQESIKVAAQHIYKPYETNIAKLGIKRFIFNGFGSGFINGLVGFGGSMSIVPVMCILGLHPRAATASTSFLTMFSSGMSVVISILGGQIGVDEFGFLFGISFSGAFIFTFLLNKVVDHFKLDSFTIAFTAFAQGAVLLACIGLFIVNLVNQPFDDQLKTRDFC